MYKILNHLLLFVFSTLLIACDSDNKNYTPPPPTPMSIVDVAAENGNFTTLVAALEATGLDETLDNLEGRFTVFAPTDAAFALLGEETINALLADTDQLSSILLYHVISGSKVSSAAAIAAAGTTVESANGAEFALSLNGNNLLVNLSSVTAVDIQASNGVIHVIDAVLIPPIARGEPTNNIVETAVAAGNFTTLVTALQAADLDGLLADETKTFTVFAPTDAAFELLGEENINLLLDDMTALNAVLTQHVIADAEVNSIAAYAANGTSITTASGAMVPVNILNKTLQVGGATVTTADIYTVNGIIHVIDAVIIGDVELPTPPQSIMDVAVTAGGFTTLVAALEATGLDTTLADLEGNFTVFAPTDAAFAALGQETINALLADTETLSNILLYHVIPNAVVLSGPAVTVAGSDDPQVLMANGDAAGLSLNDSKLYINLSTVISPDVLAANGVIHAVDKVMLPPVSATESELTITATAAADERFSTLVAALQAADLDVVLDDEDATFTVFAPTNAAFAKIPSDTLNALLADVPALSEVLLHHVISGAAVNSVTAFTLNGKTANTAAGLPVSLEIVNGQLQIEGSNVTIFDIYTSNGIIHVIDTVITSSLE